MSTSDFRGGRGHSGGRDRPAPDAEASPSAGQELRAIVGALFAKRRVIMASIALALLGALAFIWVSPTLFVGRTEILVEPRAKRLTDREVVPTGLGSSSMGADVLLVDSQVKLILSRRVLEQVVEMERLTTDPEFVSEGPGPVWGAARAVIRFVLRGPGAPLAVTPPPLEQALDKLTQRLRVERKANTYVLEVTALSTEAEKAARIANSVATAFLRETTESARTGTSGAFTALSGRLEELREQAARDEQAVEEYRKRSELLGAADRTLLDRQLESLNAQLSEAHAETRRAQARAEQARRLAGNPLALAAEADVRSPSVLAQLQAQVATAVAHEASLATSLLPSHPTMVSVARERRALQDALKRETDRIVERLKLDHELAREREAALERQLTAMKERAADSNVASIRLRQLVQRAEASRSVYQTFLTRSREAHEQIGLETESARVISEARPSARPALPAVPIILAAGLALGILFGVACAWVLHLLEASKAPQRVPSRNAATPDQEPHRLRVEFVRPVPAHESV